MCCKSLVVHQIVIFYLVFCRKGNVFAQIVSSPSNPTSVVTGKDITLEWTTTKAMTEASWGIKKLNEKTFETTLIYVSGSNSVQMKNTGVGEAGESYKDRISFVGDLTNKKAAFKISNVQPSDAREYLCQVLQTGEIRYKFSWIRVDVTVPANVTQPQVKSHYIKEEKVNITCQATGNPAPTVKWTRVRGNKEYPSATGAAHLVFSSVQKEDAGKYTCSASNTGGSAQAQVDIVVYYKPEQTHLKSNASGNVAISGDYVLLTCTVGAAKPAPPQYSFYRDNDLLSSSSEGEYLIQNIQYSSQGIYKCTPRNVVGDGQEANLTLTVKEPAKIISSPSATMTVVEGESIPLVCKATGHPQPTVTWTKDGQPFDSGENVTIVESTRNNKGIYTCTAKNDVKKPQMATTTVTVHYKPEVSSSSSNSTVGSWVNNQIILQCVAFGVPTPTFQWYHPDNKQITTNIDPILNGSRVTITTSTSGDYGQYKCHATNIVGTTDYIILVKEWKKPEKPLQVALKETQASYVRVSWAPPSNDGGSKIIDYKVKIQRNTGSTPPKLYADKVNGMELLVDKLIPGASYSLLVYARNIVGYGTAAVLPFTTLKQGKPGIPLFNITTISDTSVTLSWLAAAENGAEIIMYTIWWREIDSNKATTDWVSENITRADLKYEVTGLKVGKTYQFGVTAWNKYGQSALDEEKGLKQADIIEPTVAPTKPLEKSTGVSAAAIGGGAAAGLVIILLVIIVIVILKRRKASPRKGESRDPLGSSGDEGYSSVSKASAARRLGRNNAASEDAAVPTYATVDMSKKKPKKPDLIYAELADFNENPAAQAASMKRQNQANSYVPSDYAEIAQFGRPSEEPTYDNVPRY